MSLALLRGAGAVLEGALLWSGRELSENLESFPERMATRLEELEVDDSSLEEWLKLW